MWKIKLSQKLKVFMWLVFQDTLQRGVNLKKRRWKGDEKCYLCRVVETMDHIFFECHVARVILVLLQRSFRMGHGPLVVFRGGS